MEIGADNKDKIAERRFAEMNQTLRKEHLLQQDYYKELLDVQSCGVMAYTLPGHRIVHMNAEALRMYGYYDLILMDVQMPRMNGYDATSRMRKRGSWSSKITSICKGEITTWLLCLKKA